MTEPTSNRKLAAVLAADIVGYSRLMQADDEATLATLKEYRAAVGRIIARHAGRVVNTPGVRCSPSSGAPRTRCAPRSTSSTTSRAATASSPKTARCTFG